MHSVVHVHSATKLRVSWITLLFVSCSQNCVKARERAFRSVGTIRLMYQDMCDCQLVSFVTLCVVKEIELPLGAWEFFF
jgi:hypothetical protein